MREAVCEFLFIINDQNTRHWPQSDRTMGIIPEVKQLLEQ